MNAKKIMGAVLVALLAAALFVGAGAAETVFVYENVSKTSKTATVYQGTWSNAGAVVTVGADNIVVPGANFVPGVYSNGTTEIYITYPTATITGVKGEGLAAYPFIGGNLFQGTVAGGVTLTNSSASPNVDVVSLYVTYPNNTKELVATSALQAYLATDKPDLGTYTVQAYFDYNKFANGTDVKYLLSEAVSFTVVEEGTATISASADKVLKSDSIILSITGQPGKVYNVTYEDAYLFNVSENQLFFGQKLDSNKGFNFTMPNSGKVDFAIVANASMTLDETEKITLEWKIGTEDKSKTVTIAFAKGTITAKADAASYFIGDTITIEGTTTAGPLTGYYINGTNFVNQSIAAPTTNSGGDFTIYIKTGSLVDQGTQKKIDVGTYTLTLMAGEAKTTVALVLKQPFISIISAPEVIVKGDDAEFIINAEATEKIAYYIFGTNYFVNDSLVNDHVMDDENEPIENQFKITLNGKTVTDKMDAGQYFMVIQHPMYDTNFNILSFEQAVYQNTTAEVASSNYASSEKLFNVDLRQTANAAQALCDALDSQNIDDMYVKYSFFVVGKDASFTISEIPTTIAQGETLTISGVSTSAAEEYVTVEMISTAFAAVPKETVGSAAFIAVTTQVAEDGTWEVTLDTSDLNVDEYSLKVACGEDTWKNVNINVVEGAETPDTPDTPDVPDTPDTPDTPTEPTTPGFGALAALAGLGAVAVLLLRRE